MYGLLLYRSTWNAHLSSTLRSSPLLSARVRCDAKVSIADMIIVPENIFLNDAGGP